MWELSMKIFFKMAADRGRYIDHSQSTNIYISDPTPAQLIACHMYSTALGLKTNMYYLRQLGVQPVKFTIDPNLVKYVSELNADVLVEDDDDFNIDSEDDGSAVPVTPTSASSVTTPGGKKVVCTDTVCIACQ
jgi:ribonucleotide reductase alpha subunit